MNIAELQRRRRVNRIARGILEGLSLSMLVFMLAAWLLVAL